MQLSHEIKYLLGILAVEIAGGLVCEQQSRLHRQRPRNRYPLLLAARQLVRKMVRSIGERHRLQELVGAGSGCNRRFAGDPQRQRDVVARVKLVEKVVVLKDKTDIPVAQVGAGLSVKKLNIIAVEHQTPVVGPIEEADQVKQRALPNSGWPYHRKHLPLRDIQVEVSEHLDPGAAGTKALTHSTKLHEAIHSEAPQPVPDGR